MAIPLAGQLYEKVAQGAVPEAVELLAAHPNLLRISLPLDRTWLHLAAHHNRVQMAEMLVAAGIDVNAPCEDLPDSPLSEAAGNGCLAVAKWLIEHGAKVDGLTPNAHPTPLAEAAVGGHYEMVEYLLSQGANAHACYGTPPKNALSLALAQGHVKVADLLRTQGVGVPGEGHRQSALTTEQQIIAHAEKLFGQVQEASLQEIVPSSNVPISIHIAPPTKKRKTAVLFTSGISSRPMRLRSECSSPQYAELVLELSPDWPLGSKMLEDPRWAWPVLGMRMLASTAHGKAGALMEGKVVTYGEPPRPLGPGTNLTCWLMLPDLGGLEQLRTREGILIQFYRLFAIYQKELELLQRAGLEKLVELFHKRNVESYINPTRMPATALCEND